MEKVTENITIGIIIIAFAFILSAIAYLLIPGLKDKAPFLSIYLPILIITLISHIIFNN